MVLFNQIADMDDGGILMDIIRDLLKNMSDEASNSIYLREIALLMEEIELLKDKVRDREKEVENLMKVVGDKNAK